MWERLCSFEPTDIFKSVNYNEDCSEDISLGTYTIKGNKITTNEDGDQTEATITKLTSTELVVEFPVDFDGDGTMEKISSNFSTK